MRITYYSTTIMKRYYILLLISFFSLVSIQAKQIGLNQATGVATNFAQSKQQLRSSNSQEIKLAYTATNESNLKSSSDEESAYYYIFNIGDEGFVVVSGNDITVPVLGYSDGSVYSANNIPPAFEYWMNGVKQEIKRGIESDLQCDDQNKALWDSYLNGNHLNIKSENADTYLLKTRWNQLDPYNGSCPLFGTERTVTGCVATTMAQIMKYYNYPAKGKGSKDAYAGSLVAVPAVNFDVDYDWDNMLDVYTDPLNVPTQTQKEAVATLMYHCGVSVSMNYSTNALGGSAASDFNAAKALVDYFGYSNELQMKYRTYYSDEEWENMLKNEIDNKRPVLYSGYYTILGLGKGGHTFVCDGYNDENYFHFNWGWGGLYDGYFLTKVLNPGTGGAGSGAGTFNETQSAIINIIDKEGGIATPDVNLFEDKSITVSTNLVKQDETFTVTFQPMNTGISDYVTGYYGVVLIDKEDKIVDVVGNLGPYQLPSRSYYDPFNITCKVSDKIPVGDYTIKAAYKLADGTWSVCRATTGSINTLSLVVEEKVVNNSIAQQKTGSLNVYFNSSTEKLHVKSNENIQSIRIADVSGNVLKTVPYSQSISDIEIPVDGLCKNCLYIVTIQTNAGIFTKKLILM